MYKKSAKTVTIIFYYIIILLVSLIPELLIISTVRRNSFAYEFYSYDAERNLTQVNSDKRISWNVNGKIDTIFVDLLIYTISDYNAKELGTGCLVSVRLGR